VQIIQDKALLVDSLPSKQVTEAIRKSAPVEGGALVYWGFRETEKLASLGVIDVPSPLLRDYAWTGRLVPFAHQKTTASFLSVRKRAFCLSSQGTGKTASCIWAADYLMNLGKVKRVLVVCPLSIMKAAWQTDLFRFAMHRSVGIAHGSASARKKVIESDAEFVIINYDGVATVEEEITKGGFDLIIADEATCLKTATTHRWKVFNRIVKNTNPRFGLLTGTPAAQSPLDAFGLAKLVNPER